MYDYLVGVMHKYNLEGKVYICTNLKDNEFITAGQKGKIIQLSGIPEDAIINYSGYSIKGLLGAVNGNDTDVLVTAFSKKDLDDGTKLDFLKMPKDQITSWRVMKNEKDLSFLRPANFVHKEYEDNKEKKIQKGTGYVLTVPTKIEGTEIISSSFIRKLIEQNKWDEVKKLMTGNIAFNYLKEIKDNEQI